MKKTIIQGAICALLAGISLMSGCGGGDQSSKTVAIKFRTYSGAVPVKAAAFRVLLPQGVSVATTASDPKVVDPAALKLSGIFSQAPFKNYTSFIQASYSAAKPAGTGRDAVRVDFVLQSKSFTNGEFLTITGTAAPGSSTAKGGFDLDELILGGTGGVDVTSQYKFGFSVQ